METRKQIRERIKIKRSLISEVTLKEKSQLIFEKIIQTQEYKEADAVLVYVDYNHEVMTRDLMKHALQERKSVFCPKVLGEEIDFFKIYDLNELTDQYKQILEPKANLSSLFSRLNLDKPSLIIMPGLAFDRERNRLGYGMGYYDRYLYRFPMIPTIALALDCQIVDSIPFEKNDIRPSRIETESFSIV